MNMRLPERMKAYEQCTKYEIPMGSRLIARIDGKAFHTYTKGLQRPFDAKFIEDMDATAIYLCSKISNVNFAYVQSDEISLYMKEKTYDAQPWFGNKIQKMASVAASMATAEFNKRRLLNAMKKPTMFQDGFERNLMMNFELETFKMAEFDARFFTVPSNEEVMNYFVWRQRDCIKNSIASCAQNKFSAKQLHKKNGNDMLQMLFDVGWDWNSMDLTLQRGRIIERKTYINDRPANLLELGENEEVLGFIYDEYQPGDSALYKCDKDTKIRNIWESSAAPVFSDLNSLQNI